MIQVDKFDKLRSEFGTEMADELLKEFAVILGQGVREFDVVVRSGEVEFVVLLPRTHFTGSLAVATRIWQKARDHYFMYQDRRIPISVSMGVSFFPNKDVATAEHMVDQANQALGKALDTGGSQICLYQHTTYFYRPDMGR